MRVLCIVISADQDLRSNEMYVSLDHHVVVVHKQLWLRCARGVDGRVMVCLMQMLA